MKRILLLSFIISTALHLFAQTEGITYQAVIINPNGQELPGVDAEGNILPNAEISIRFTIIDENNTEEYQEIQNTLTDEYGMVNLLIGQANQDAFLQINWDGVNKDLKVEIDFSGSASNFDDISRQELTFVPYAYHRNIIAKGTLRVDDTTELNSELWVLGPTNLNSTLNVNNNNATNLSGHLNVKGITDIDSTLIVKGKTNLNDTLNVGNFMTVEGKASFKDSTSFEGPSGFNELSVDGTSNLNGQVTIDANMDTMGIDSVYRAYPLIVEGGSQGIAIKVNSSRTTNNNYISFWDEDGDQMWGRIEGQTTKELNSDPEYGWEIGNRIADISINSAEGLLQGVAIIFAISDLASEVIDYRVIVNAAGPGVASPSPSKIGWAIAKLIAELANGVTAGTNIALAIAEKYSFENYIKAQIGVTYQSGAGDYAEWLPKENPNEVFIAGELVGVKNGMVSKKIFGAEKVMIVSTNPIVLGNMPKENDESKYEKIAFIGQVPVRVLGSVQPGDYILPSELVMGFGKAVHPADMAARDYKKIVGVAWSVISQVGDGINIVNVSVGINTNELANVVAEQEEKLNALWAEHEQLKNQMEQSNAALVNLVPGYAESIGYSTISGSYDTIQNTVNRVNNQLKSNIVYPTFPDDKDIVTIEVTREHVEEGIEVARKSYQQMLDDANQINKILSSNNSKSPSGSGYIQNYKSPDFGDVLLMPMDEHPFWKRINSDPDYKEEIIQYMRSSLDKAFQSQELSNDSVKYNIKFTNF
jgi:hypothetical protein